MGMKKMIRKAKRAAVGISILFLGGCDMFAADKEDAVSRDIGALQRVVKISVPAKAIKWEIFGTPEDKGGGAPGPTDYVTLVAEVETTDRSWIGRLQESAGKEWIAPESVRPWLSPYFQILLNKSNTDVNKLNNCKKYEVEVTKSGRLVNGFACEHEGLLLIHVKLMGPSAKNPNPDGPPVFE